MKTPLWVVLLLSLCVPTRGDCQGDCLSCALLLTPQQNFNTLVCLLGCEAQAFPAHTWDLCYQAMGLNPAVLPSHDFSKRTEDEDNPLAVVKMENEEGVEYSEALERFRHMAQALGAQELSEGPQKADQFAEIYDQGLDSSEDEEDLDAADKRELQDQDVDGALDLSKRFGGFMKGRNGFRKLVSSGRPLQKRYGGFIGIRKSARKWNNQKRVSQLLRQYLSLTARTGRSGHFPNLSAVTVRQKNEV